MASRIAYGQEVSVEKLKQVEAAEDFLGDLGFKVLRVRHHGETARIEVHPQSFAKILSHKEKITQNFRELGFAFVALDLVGFRSGSLNTILNKRI